MSHAMIEKCSVAIKLYAPNRKKDLHEHGVLEIEGELKDN